MQPSLIVRELQLMEITQTDIAKKAGLDPTSRAQVSAVIHRRCRSRRIETAIAKALQKDLHELWPEWYAPGGKRKRRALAA